MNSVNVNAVPDLSHLQANEGIEQEVDRLQKKTDKRTDDSTKKSKSLVANLLDSPTETKNDLFLFTESIVNVKDLGPRECKNPENSVRIANYAFYSKTIKNKFLEICLKECIKRHKK